MPSSLTAARQNQLLAALSTADLEALLPDLELLDLAQGHPLHRPGAEMLYAYFPLTSIVSLLYEMDGTAMTEVSVVGNEGIIGVSIFLGGETTLSMATVESAGFALRLSDTALRKAFRQAGKLQKLLLLYMQAFSTEIAQTLACVREHTLHQRFCRWLLMRFDRLPADTLRMSQAKIAGLMGVRRSSISKIASELNTHKAISYSRGCLRLLDRSVLERQSCDCYQVIKNEFERLLPTTLPGTSAMRTTEVVRKLVKIG
jgi:CRP-like cAMP-binding protein